MRKLIPAKFLLTLYILTNFSVFAHAQYSDIDTDYTNSFAGAAMSKWEEMKVTLWGMFGRGF